MSVPVPHSRVLEKIVAINSSMNVKMFNISLFYL